MFLMGLSVTGRTVEACKVHSGEWVRKADIKGKGSSWTEAYFLEIRGLSNTGLQIRNVQNLCFFEIPVNQLMNAYGIPIKCLIFCSDNQDSQGTGSLEWIYIIKGDAVHWLTDVEWVSQQWPSAHWRGWETECLSGHELEYLSYLNLAWKAWRISGEFLVFSPCWKSQKL